MNSIPFGPAGNYKAIASYKMEKLHFHALLQGLNRLSEQDGAWSLPGVKESVINNLGGAWCAEWHAGPHPIPQISLHRTGVPHDSPLEDQSTWDFALIMPGKARRCYFIFYHRGELHAASQVQTGCALALAHEDLSQSGCMRATIGLPGLTKKRSKEKAARQAHQQWHAFDPWAWPSPACLIAYSICMMAGRVGRAVCASLDLLQLECNLAVGLQSSSARATHTAGP